MNSKPDEPSEYQLSKDTADLHYTGKDLYARSRPFDELSTGTPLYVFQRQTHYCRFYLNANRFVQISVILIYFVCLLHTIYHAHSFIYHCR